MKPFLKWAGGKYKIIDKVKSKLPQGDRLVEPFVGSGAVFMNTEYDRYLLADSNADLINTFVYLQTQGLSFIDYCKQFFTPENNIESVFYELRQEFNDTQDKRKKSALFIYLNRHCFNGLCRYNGSGKFNVPFGRYASPMFPEKEMIAFFEKSHKAEFKIATFEDTFKQDQKNDVVYCDPPYVPLSPSSSFTAYTKNGFTLNEQLSLAAHANAQMARGICVVISNHDTVFTREAYAAASIEAFDVQRYISSKASDRKPAGELLALFA